MPAQRRQRNFQPQSADLRGPPHALDEERPAVIGRGRQRHILHVAAKHKRLSSTSDTVADADNTNTIGVLRIRKGRHSLSVGFSEVKAAEIGLAVFSKVGLRIPIRKSRRVCEFRFRLCVTENRQEWPTDESQ